LAHAGGLGIGVGKKYFAYPLAAALFLQVLAAERFGDSPIKSDMKLEPQMHLGAESQSEGTIQLVPKP